MYLLQVPGKGNIKVEISRLSGQVKIQADLLDGRSIMSAIANGTVIWEKDLNSGRTTDLEDEFKKLYWEISSLPDDDGLRIIGGNYGILNTFLGRIEKKPRRFRFNWRKLPLYVFGFPFLIFKNFRTMVRTLMARPSIWDAVDMAMVSAMSYYTYLVNFNIFHAGAVAASGALATGITDLLIRRRGPYPAKILLLFLPGLIAVWLGYRYQ